MLKKVQLTLISLQYDPPEPDQTEPTPPTRIEQHTVARLRQTDDQIALTYDEPDESGNGDVQVRLQFSTKEPQTVTLTRGGAQSYQLLFCDGKRSRTEYAIAGMSFDICAVTRRLQNHLLTDGTLHLEYTIELQGCSNGVRIIDIKIEDCPPPVLREYR
jgi:uncharacterized beta-barrel protein YwiB (DUF1934 family)